MHTISFDRLTKRYGPVLAVGGLSFDVGPGRSPVPPGPTGALLYIAEPLLGLTPTSAPRSSTTALAAWPPPAATPPAPRSASTCSASRRARASRLHRCRPARRHRTAQQARHHLTTHPHHPNTTNPGDEGRPGVCEER